MNKYEVLYILSSELEDAQRDAIIERYSALVAEKGGEVESVNKWGMKKLAYPINFKREGFYVLMTYTAPSDFNAELERQMRIAAGQVIRFIVVKK